MPRHPPCALIRFFHRVIRRCWHSVFLVRLSCVMSYSTVKLQRPLARPRAAVPAAAPERLLRSNRSHSRLSLFYPIKKARHIAELSSNTSSRNLSLTYLFGSGTPAPFGVKCPLFPVSLFRWYGAVYRISCPMSTTRQPPGLVEMMGLEPMTYAVQRHRSPI